MASVVLSVILGISPRSGATKVPSSMLRTSSLPPEGNNSAPSSSTYTEMPPLCHGPAKVVAFSTTASPLRVGWRSAAVGAEPSSLTTGSGKTSLTPPSTQLDCTVTPHASAGNSWFSASMLSNPRASVARSIAVWTSRTVELHACPTSQLSDLYAAFRALVKAAAVSKWGISCIRESCPGKASARSASVRKYGGDEGGEFGGVGGRGGAGSAGGGAGRGGEGIEGLSGTGVVGEGGAEGGGGYEGGGGGGGGI